jgi:hypothetical protein
MSVYEDNQQSEVEDRRSSYAVPISIRNRSKTHIFDIIIDTGATSNVISHDLVRKMDLLEKIDRSEATYYLHAGGSSRMVGSIVLSCSIGDYDIEQLKFAVVPSQSLLLGMAFFEQYDTSIKLKKRILRIDDVRIPIYPAEQETKMTTINSYDSDDYDLLTKIMRNIIKNPDEEKYRAINKKVLQRKMKSVSIDFLLTHGFIEVDGHLMFLESAEELRAVIDVL